MTPRIPITGTARALVAVALCLVAGAAAACGGSSGGSGSSSGPIRIGASIPLSGALAGFGGFEKWGYQHAVDLVNRKGGLEVGGKRRKVDLILLDDKTDPNTTSNNVTRLITQDHVDALLGSCTPALVNAGALVADRNRVPMVTPCDPLEAFKSVKDWQYVWDLFFDEPDLAALPFDTVRNLGLDTNEKVAIVHDNGPDGSVLGGQLWPKLAKQRGWDVVVNQSFPVSATDFGSVVQKVKASGADVVLVDSGTPQAIAIRKQMRTAQFTPKVLVMEKGAEPVQFAGGLGSLADGTMVGGYWDPSFPYPGAKDLRKQFEHDTGHTFSQHIADSEAAAQILLDAITRAGSTDKEKVNQAIGRTDKTYVVGPIRFDDKHTAALPVVELQWQHGKTIVVGPTKKVATGRMLFPVPSS